MLLKVLHESIAGGMAGVSSCTVLHILLCVSIAYVVTPEYYYSIAKGLNWEF